MLLLIIYAICCAFFYFIQQSIIYLSLTPNLYLVDQLKSICCFLRNHTRFSNFKSEDLGLSNAFFENKIEIKETPDTLITFDSIFLNCIPELRESTLLDQSYAIFVNTIPLKPTMILYYSHYLMIHYTTPSKSMQLLPNNNALIQNYTL